MANFEDDETPIPEPHEPHTQADLDRLEMQRQAQRLSMLEQRMGALELEWTRLRHALAAWLKDL